MFILFFSTIEGRISTIQTRILVETYKTSFVGASATTVKVIPPLVSSLLSQMWIFFKPIHISSILGSEELKIFPSSCTHLKNQSEHITTHLVMREKLLMPFFLIHIMTATQALFLQVCLMLLYQCCSRSFSQIDASRGGNRPREKSLASLFF
jgi:hypothetical protein